MQDLKNNIRLVTLLAPAVLDEDNSPITSSIIDTREIDKAGSPMFDSALIRARFGTFGANVTAVKVKIHESDASNGASSTLADGGTEVTLAEAGEVSFQVKRSKRYIFAIVTITADGATDTVPGAINGILCNWALPFPIV